MISKRVFVTHIDTPYNTVVVTDYTKEKILTDLEAIYKDPCHGSLNNLLSSGVRKVMGWEYDYRPFLNLYLYKCHGNWYEGYAPSKKLLKEAVKKITKILVLKKGEEL